MNLVKHDTYDYDTYPLIIIDNNKDIINSVTKKVSDIKGISIISTFNA